MRVHERAHVRLREGGACARAAAAAEGRGPGATPNMAMVLKVGSRPWLGVAAGTPCSLLLQLSGAWSSSGYSSSAPPYSGAQPASLLLERYTMKETARVPITSSWHSKWQPGV